MQRRSLKRKAATMDPTTWKKYKYTPKATTASLARKVNKILSEQERKNLDVSNSSLAVSSTATIIQLNSITQGDDATSRDGRKVSMVSSQMKYTFGPSVGTGTVVSPFRVIVFIDKQSNGVAPVAADVLTAPTNVLSPLTLDFKERFRVIHDNYSSLGKGNFDMMTGAANGVSAVIPGDYFRRIPDELAQVEFGGIGNIPTSGALYMLVLSVNASTMGYYHRLRFTDS